MVCTPHLGASTQEAQEGVSIEVVEAVVDALAGKLSSTAVNAPLVAPEVLKELQPYVTLAEGLGKVRAGGWWPRAALQQKQQIGQVPCMAMPGSCRVLCSWCALIAACLHLASILRHGVQLLLMQLGIHLASPPKTRTCSHVPSPCPAPKA